MAPKAWVWWHATLSRSGTTATSGVASCLPEREHWLSVSHPSLGSLWLQASRCSDCSQSPESRNEWTNKPGTVFLYILFICSVLEAVKNFKPAQFKMKSFSVTGGCLNKTFFTHFDCEYVRINGFLWFETGSCWFLHQECLTSKGKITWTKFVSKFQTVIQTIREQPKSAPYLRLTNHVKFWGKIDNVIREMKTLHPKNQKCWNSQMKNIMVV